MKDGASASVATATQEKIKLYKLIYGEDENYKKNLKHMDEFYKNMDSLRESIAKTRNILKDSGSSGQP